jgi:hypothetical protein
MKNTIRSRLRRENYPLVLWNSHEARGDGAVTSRSIPALGGIQAQKVPGNKATLGIVKIIRLINNQLRRSPTINKRTTPSIPELMSNFSIKLI